MEILGKSTGSYTDSLGVTHFIAEVIRRAIDNQRLYLCWVYSLDGEVHLMKTDVSPSEFFSQENPSGRLGLLDDYLTKHDLSIVNRTT